MPLVFPVTGMAGLTVGGIEIAGNNYARQAVLFTIAADGSYVSNIEGLVWPTAYPYGWGLIDGVPLYDAAGALICTAVPVQTVTVDAYESARIRPGGYVVTRGASVGTPYGMRRYGMGRYAREAMFQGWVELIEIGFDRMDPCIPGVWEPADACAAAAWEPVDLCAAGTWGPAQKPLRRAA